MPIFDFICDKCKTESKDILILGSEQDQMCNTCNTKLTKQITTIGGINLIGDGFFKPGYTSFRN